MRERTFETWEELLQALTEFDGGWLFRGQRNATWQPSSSLERASITDEDRRGAETKLLREFRRRAHLYLAPQHIPAVDETAEWLALMQHFGAPTRLLDVTRSPFVATYFAVEDATDDVDCALWAFRRDWCLSSAGRFLLGDDQDGGHSESRAMFKRLENELGLKGWPMNPSQRNRILVEVGAKLADLTGDEWRHRAIPIVLPFVPERLSERLSIQQGEFLVSHDLDRSFMSCLGGRSDSGANVLKCTIRTRLRGRILEQFRLMNIGRAQLFPGLDGFGQSFRHLLVMEPQDQRWERIDVSGNWWNR